MNLGPLQYCTNRSCEGKPCACRFRLSAPTRDDKITSNARSQGTPPDSDRPCGDGLLRRACPLTTDGWLKRAATGELFGFDRVKVMGTQSADFIVQAAQSFGQDDDITVLTLRFTPTPTAKT